MTDHSVDILENDFQPEVLEQLLRDHTTRRNIFWATHDYEQLGKGYQYFDEIKPERITTDSFFDNGLHGLNGLSSKGDNGFGSNGLSNQGDNGLIVKPRVMKSKAQQTDRSKDMAEVFTPSWVCNAQNNLVDEAWFGHKDVFNTEDSEKHEWRTNNHKIEFSEGKTWRDYVRATRMEMTCGEAPYLVSRYDTTTGNPIPLPDRIGLLDRKLRIVSENTCESGEWLEWAQVAYKNTYEKLFHWLTRVAY